MPPDDVTALEAGDRADEYPAVAHDQIIALHQQKSKISGKIGLLVVGEAHRTWAQNSNARLRTLACGFQTTGQRAKERGESFDIELRIEIRKGLGDDEAVLEGIAAARRGLRPVSEHPPSAVRSAPDVDRVETQPSAARRTDAPHRSDEVR